MSGHWILKIRMACTAIVAVLLSLAHAVSAASCDIQSVHRDVTLLGGLAAGKFTTWEPRENNGLTSLENCREHCCMETRVDLVFMVNSFCFCVKCHSRRLCTLLKVTPPAAFRSYAIVLTRGSIRSSRPPISASARSNLFATKPHQRPSQQPELKSERPTERRTTGVAVTQHADAETKHDGLGRRTTLSEDEENEDNGGWKTGCGLAGLIPYFIFLVQLCQVDLALKATHPIPPTANALTNGGHVVAGASQKSGGAAETVVLKTQDSVSDLTTPPSTWRSAAPRPTRVVTVKRNATGTGNDDIMLQCPGTIHIIRVMYSNIEGNEDTVSRLNKVCQDSLTKADKLNQCAVSLEKVYGTPYKSTEKTEVFYSCTYNLIKR